MNRRQFLIATAATVTAGCTSVDNGNGSGATRPARLINAGPVAHYAADGVYDSFGDVGFFVVSKDGKLTVLSAICTHRTCKLNAERDHSFYCKCHGSTFDPNGNVTHGPAKRPLPVLSSVINERQELIVTVPGS
jgi:cytochrome b6-f complex iron-sulfur subunit